MLTFLDPDGFPLEYVGPVAGFTEAPTPGCDGVAYPEGQPRPDALNGVELLPVYGYFCRYCEAPDGVASDVWYYSPTEAEMRESFRR